MYRTVIILAAWITTTHNGLGLFVYQQLSRNDVASVLDLAQAHVHTNTTTVNNISLRQHQPKDQSSTTLAIILAVRKIYTAAVVYSSKSRSGHRPGFRPVADGFELSRVSTCRDSSNTSATRFRPKKVTSWSWPGRIQAQTCWKPGRKPVLRPGPRPG